MNIKYINTHNALNNYILMFENYQEYILLICKVYMLIFSHDFFLKI